MNTVAEFKNTFDAQRRMLPALRAATAEQRIAKLQKLQGVVHAHFGEAVAALAMDLGKPPFEAAFDIGSTLAEIGHVIAQLGEWMAPTPVVPNAQAAAGASAKIIYEPRGRILIFSPWNFPFGLLFQPLIGAIAAGNAAILKPSELAPATASLAARIVAETFDETEVALFQGGPEVAEALLDLPFDHIFFTGSTEVGRRIMTAAGKHLATVTLELGGKCPVIVDRSANIEKAAERIVRGKFLNAGQICLAPDHVWVHADRRDAFTAAVLARISTHYYADGSYNQRDSARIINERHLGRIKALIDKSVADGGTLLAGGRTDGLFLEPTILADVTPDSAIMGEEIFGPVLPILTYRDNDQLVETLGQGDKPLALYVFSDDPIFIEAMLSRTSSGGVTVNDVIQHAADSTLPFGGVGASGMGAYHGVHSFRELSHAKSVYIQAAGYPGEASFNPPYDNRMPM